MNQYKFSVIVPVIYLTEYSRKALSDIAEKARAYQDILFILSCSDAVADELRDIFLERDRASNVVIAPSKISGSNHLRQNGIKYAETEYIYYQDCDDEVDYQVIIDNLLSCMGNNVVCFNIRRRQYDEDGKVVDDRLLYPGKSYKVGNISQLMTNIVNKLIPKASLEQVCFYNIPFSQDLSLSFQLYEKCPHYYCGHCAYLYENNYKSTAGLKKTKRESLLRVVAVERILLRLLLNKDNKAFVKYRYEIMIQGRFAYLKECYWPSFSLRAISPFSFGLRKSVGHLYHYVMAYLSCLRLRRHK